ncbi:MAG: biosynthetic-type acetolactate synthase large subunit [Mogibacterium sp.]|nr:biosynthetic-type acetolactate synthase large subunit [Mogibacterium sp.]
MKLTGSQIVAEVLLEHGVDVVFGYPGGTALNIYDELYKYSDRITHILTADEQGASFAADGYARATGKTGVVFSTSGPGATNLVTGIATANLDSIPMVAITANVPDALIGKDAFQEVSITGVTLPITKHNFFVNRIENLADALRSAFQIANSGRKGPVLVDITKDVTADTIDFEHADPLPLRAMPEISKDDIQAAARMINVAEKPVMYIGGGVVSSRASDLVVKLAEKADIPVCHTLMAAGVIGYDHELNLGLVGMHGSVASNRAIDQADLIIAIGARFSDRVALNPERWGRKAKILQIDVDKSEINKNVLVDRYCVGDARDFLSRAIDLVEETRHEEWHQRVVGWKLKVRSTRTTEWPLTPYDIMTILCDTAPSDSIYVTDVGQHQMWAAQYLKHRSAKQFITSGGLGTMGYGYGAAIGAQCGNPGNRVIHITGDGSFQMNLNEVVTAETYDLPIITVIMNNGVLGMVYQWQTLFYDKRYSNTVMGRKINYQKVAEGFNIKGYRAKTPEEFQEAIDKALADNCPVWIECVISQEERVLPMIPGGKTVDDMIIN